MQAFFTILTLYGTFTILFGLISLFIKERLYISETVISTVFGIVIGEKGIDVLGRLERSVDSSLGSGLTRRWLDPELIMFYLSRLVISLQVVAVGSVVPYAFLREHIRMVLFLIGPVMVVTYLCSFFIIYLFTWNILPLPMCLVVAACVTPTDPVLASSILKGKFANRYIPRQLRNLLILEGGINDGLAYPLLTLPLFYIQWVISTFGSDNLDGERLFTSLNQWLPRPAILSVLYRWGSFTLLYEIVFACVYGLLIGYLSKKALLFSKRRNFIDKENDLSFLLGVSLMVTGTTGLLKSDDILACFFCGIAFSYTGETGPVTTDKFLDRNMRDENFLEQTDWETDFIETGIVVERDGSIQSGQGIRRDELIQSGQGIRRDGSIQSGTIHPRDELIQSGQGIRRDGSIQSGHVIRRDELIQSGIIHPRDEPFQTGQLPQTDTPIVTDPVQPDRVGTVRDTDETSEHNTGNDPDVHRTRTTDSPFRMNVPDTNNQVHSFYEILDILINSMFFMIYGYFLKVDPKYLPLSIVLLILKRLPFFMALPLFRNTKERFFAGWYGPVGVGALFFFSHFRHELYEHLPAENMPLIQMVNECEIIINTIVLSSVILHGTTAIVINLALRKKRKVEQEMYFVSESENEEI